MRSLLRRTSRRHLRAVALAAGLLAAPGAEAEVLPFDADFLLAVESVYGTLFVEIGGAGLATVGGAGAHVASLDLAGGAIATAGRRIAITSPGVAPIDGLQVTLANAAGHFARTPSGHLAGAMPLPGVAKLCVFRACGADPIANVTVPLTPIGGGGVATAMGGLFDVTLRGGRWTTRTILVPGNIGSISTVAGFAHGPGSATSSTAQPGGSIQLVTPFTVETHLGADGPNKGFSVLALRFAPEPSAALLLGAGIALLAAGWGQRLRSS